MGNTSPPPDDPAKFIASLEPDDLRILSWLIKTLRMVDGWCRVNRAIGKFLIVGLLLGLIMLSNALDAVKNLLGLKH